MPRETDPFWKYVKPLPNKMWTCNFCGNQYAGSATRIKAHLAGLGGYGIHGCKVVNGRLRSEAQKALKGKGPVEPSNGSQGNVQGSSYPHLINSSLTQGLHHPVTVGNEDAWRETSLAAMPSLSSDATCTVGATSSAFLPVHETNQSLPAESIIPNGDFSFWLPPPQSRAGDSNIQPRNLSYSSSGRDLTPEVLTNMPRPENAEEGEPTTELPQDVEIYHAPVDRQPVTCGLVNEDMPTLKRKLKELSNQEADMLKLEALCRKTKTIKGEYWSMVRAFQEGRSLALQQKERVDDLSKAVEEILGHCNFQKGPTTYTAGCRKSFPLVTTELVGDKSQATIEETCDYLMKEEIFIIGICGMGGVGKTAILMHVHNRILENNVFSDVLWITVPQDFSVYELQDEIANVVGLDNLSKFKDVRRRACILNRHLKKKKAVLILDGLWIHFDVEDVGIPIEKGSIKLVLTTRSLDVCHKMFCQKLIIMKPLLWLNDCWNLFLKKLSCERELYLEDEETAESIVIKCQGLPLGIIEVATRMRGVEEVHEWRAMLRKLEAFTMELDVFKSLKLSYINLGDPQLQQCFLHLVLCFGFQKYPQYKRKLVESFIDDGLLGGIGNRQELHDQGNTILDKLRKDCLWDHLEEEFLHPLTRDMALHIVNSTTHMIKAYMGLKEIPEEKFWTDSLEKVFLQGNEIKEIPYGISPNCPKLMRLSLNDNVTLKAIHESFFRHLKGLKVVDFSDTGLTELVDAISHLESLEALLLQGCEKLRRIPCVRKLESLKKLDLNGCSMIENMPEGMEMLVNLSYLDLCGTKIETLPEQVLAKLVNLQYLVLNSVMDEDEELKVKGLYCSTLNVEIFNAWVRFLEHSSFRQYKLALNVLGDHYFEDVYTRVIIIGGCHRVAARRDGEIGGDGRALLPKNVQALKVTRCVGMTSLCEVGPLDYLEKLQIEEWEELEEMGAVHFPKLRELEINGCSKLKHLLEEGQGLPRLEEFSLRGSEELKGINIAAPNLKRIMVVECPEMKRAVEWGWLTTRFPELESMRIFRCEKLEKIISGTLPSGAPCFLKDLYIIGCNNLKGLLLTHDMLLHLPHLRELQVVDCEAIEAITGTAPDMTRSSFPNLMRLALRNLPELRSICDGTMSRDSIELIYISNCPKLKRIPLQLHPLYNGLPSPPPSLLSIWINRQEWESLEWDHPLARSSLEPLVMFHDESFLC